MNGEIRRIVWYPKAKTELKEIVDYIKKDSPQNVTKVKSEDLQKISELLSILKNITPGNSSF